jgi:hypothetical protein
MSTLDWFVLVITWPLWSPLAAIVIVLFKQFIWDEAMISVESNKTKTLRY